MEQLIVFIIFYIIYGVFQAATKGKRKQQQQRRPRQVPPGQPQRRESRREAGQPQPKAPEEVELPPFLREMLGLDEPEPRPQPRRIEPEPVEDDGVYSDEEHASGFEHREFEEIDDAYDVPGRDPITPVAPPPKIPQNKLVQMLKDPHNVRNAILLKEILDKPISKRGGRFPYDISRHS